MRSISLSLIAAVVAFNAQAFANPDCSVLPELQKEIRARLHNDLLALSTGKQRLLEAVCN